MNYSNSQRAGVILYLAASLFGGYIRMEEINMKELENVMSKLEKATKKKEQMDNQIKLLKQREKKC